MAIKVAILEIDKKNLQIIDFKFQQHFSFEIKSIYNFCRNLTEYYYYIYHLINM